MTRYRKRPVEVDAIQFTGENGEDVVAFTGGIGRLESAACYGDGPPYLVMIDTLEGRMCAGRDDYIIRGVQGEFYPCKPDIFEQTYEPADRDTGYSDLVSDGGMDPRFRGALEQED